MIICMVQVPGLSSEHQLLAHCYAAEALCNLESPQQAAQQLHTAVTLQSSSDRRQAELSVAQVGADAAPQVCHCICPYDCLSVRFANSTVLTLMQDKLLWRDKTCPAHT